MGIIVPNIHLTEPMQEYVRSQIAAGAYANLSEVVRAGIRLLMRNDGAFGVAMPVHEPEAVVERRKQAAQGMRAVRAKTRDVSDAELKQWREDGRR
ncbi:MAG: type II toxin-antitoxin system ParD family antitoxin [Nevskiaceae bacterium]|jgi:putative addiction module CopG family antidote|nr:type II toxin-antitoxin system ParD family antitoxin [Nevskiaceae bacterium]